MMFRLNADRSTIQGLIEAHSWRAEKIGAALNAIGYEESFFTLEELLGWYSDIVGENPTVERALTLLASLVVNGDLQLVSNAVRDALRLQRACELQSVSGS
jgi:hypothetical protein